MFHRSLQNRLFLFLALSALLFPSPLVKAASLVDPSKSSLDTKKKIRWYDARALDVEGQGWSDLKSPYDRLPAKAESKVRGSVWSLSRHSSGIVIRFETDATTILARWKLTSDRLEMPHMPATGVSGLDLYVMTPKGWRWLANGRPKGKETTATLVSNLPKEKRAYMLYLPLYNGVESLEIGVPENAQVFVPAPRPRSQRKPMVFYGTSITHGACATRPGMTHPAILGRRLERPIINLGFSGNGRLEPEVAELLTEIDASVYVIDCLPNVVAKDVAARTEPLVKIIREKRPDTPIVLVEDRSYADSFLVSSKRTRNLASRKALKAAYEALKKAGVKNLYYIEGENLLGDDGEGTVDSSHPNDLGFVRQADAFEETLRPVLAPKS
ncbi:hypothetical protein Pan216_01980 [Planctomycetes bacterium Pan216]|uniref:SGNH hydrolase-type esterase domain-containing protein n=1 Tax=Kolteria novifilia TaxID=2527975 RepID=A0A518AXG1_9BACT|nr:hypothetical protein Pan216_01980 [Planctomycetes bacterium Pan216]